MSCRKAFEKKIGLKARSDAHQQRLLDRQRAWHAGRFCSVGAQNSSSTPPCVLKWHRGPHLSLTQGHCICLHWERSPPERDANSSQGGQLLDRKVHINFYLFTKAWQIESKILIRLRWSLQVCIGTWIPSCIRLLRLCLLWSRLVAAGKPSNVWNQGNEGKPCVNLI